MLVMKRMEVNRWGSEGGLWSAGCGGKRGGRRWFMTPQHVYEEKYSTEEHKSWRIRALGV
jgi:hypothetical protein